MPRLLSGWILIGFSARPARPASGARAAAPARGHLADHAGAGMRIDRIEVGDDQPHWRDFESLDTGACAWQGTAPVFGPGGTLSRRPAGRTERAARRQAGCRRPGPTAPGARPRIGVSRARRRMSHSAGSVRL
jgi:hypothetical protein